MIGVRYLRIENAVFLAVAFAVLLLAFFPGRFDSDSAWMYGQSADLHSVSDANSPLLTVLMSITREFVAGPAILFVTQLAVWVVGVWLVSDALIASGSPLAGQAVSLACVFPLISFIFLDVNKDTAMAATGMALLGVLMRLGLLGRRLSLYGGLGVATLALALLGFRHNAVFALAPLVVAFVMLQRPVLQRRWGRSLVVSGAIFLALVGADHVVKYRLIGSSRAWGVRQLVMFDLAGISHFSGADASSGLFGHDFKPDAMRCYTPRWHDPFEWGDCHEDGAALGRLVQTEPGRRELYRAWTHAVVSHPISYLRHRLAYFNQLTRVACTGCDTPMTTGLVWPRPWEPQPTRVSSLGVLLERAANRIYAGQLGRGCLWILAHLVCAAAASVLLRRTEQRATPILILAISASAVLYTFALLAIGIAYPSRYLHWMMMLGVVAIAMTASAVGGRRAALLRSPSAAVPTPIRERRTG